VLIPAHLSLHREHLPQKKKVRRSTVQSPIPLRGLGLRTCRLLARCPHRVRRRHHGDAARGSTRG
jgi:hypothetical protein